MSDMDKPSSEIHEVLHDRTPGLERELIDLRQRHAKLVEALDTVSRHSKESLQYEFCETMSFINQIATEALSEVSDE